MTKFVRISSARLVVERETGIEPATNSLEGCDSTTELLPPLPHPDSPPDQPSDRPRASRRVRQNCAPLRRDNLHGLAQDSPSRPARHVRRAKAGGEGRTRTFEAA